MVISASAIKELREKTGAGMMDCKKALNETSGNMEEAIDWLRKKGLAAAAKKSGRIAAEGLVAVAVSEGKGAVIELNSETDFVARNEVFQTMAKNVASVALAHKADVEELKKAALPGSGKSVDEAVIELVGSIGENIQLRRCASLQGEVVVSYVHNAVGEGLGKIGTLVSFKSTGNKTKIAELGKQIAMHVAAAKPESLTSADLDPAIVERERQIFIDQSKASGKPDNIIEKMVEGRIRKFYGEVCLLNQVFVIDGKSSVEEVIKDAEKEIGAPVQLTGFIRFALGEGVEKKEEDFAAEVAAVAGQGR
jgi:elongation factor Ts